MHTLHDDIPRKETKCDGLTLNCQARHFRDFSANLVFIPNVTPMLQRYTTEVIGWALKTLTWRGCMHGFDLRYLCVEKRFPLGR